MSEWFITARSFAAPFVSDTSERYVEADTPVEALERFAGSYKHPCGLYAAEAWPSADAYHKGQGFAAQWLSNHCRELARLTKDRGSYSVRGDEPGAVEIDGERFTIADPMAGCVSFHPPTAPSAP